MNSIRSSRSPRSLRALLAIAAVLPLVGCGEWPEAPTEDPRTRVEPWSEEVLELAGRLPIQDGGRVKPLETYAGFKLLKMHGSRKIKTPWQEKLRPTAWILDVMFHPEQAVYYPSFRVDNPDVLAAIGLTPREGMDRYSYVEIRPGLDPLMQEAQRLIKIEDKNRSIVERQLFKLAVDVRDFEMLSSSFGFARHTFVPAATPPALAGILGEEPGPGLHAILAHAEPVLDLLLAGDSADVAGVQELFRELDIYLPRGSVAIFPPAVSTDTLAEWHDVGDLASHSFRAGQQETNEFGESVPFIAPGETLALLESVESMVVNREDPVAFAASLRDLQGRSAALANARGEFRTIPLETRYNRWNTFYNALAFFLLAFVFLAVTWLAPKARLAQWGVWGSLGAAMALLVAGLTLRCLILQRPPVATLYETILFITATGVLLILVLEWITRQRIALALAPVLGAMGMFLAGKFEFREAVSSGDTMGSLVAVLRTNFWLATHVTVVTMGYAAGLVASALAHVWILGKVFGLRRGDRSFYKNIARMTYGVICFGLLFSLVGTVLGGVWANDSWGRFWGWDPKENGALMIVLWELIILHARLGGYIKDHGLAVLAILGGMVVAFSWWGVNQLGVGLHSYGFTNGIVLALSIFAAIQLLVLGTSGLWWIYQRGQRSAGSGPPSLAEE